MEATLIRNGRLRAISGDVLSIRRNMWRPQIHAGEGRPWSYFECSPTTSWVFLSAQMMRYAWLRWHSTCRSVWVRQTCQHIWFRCFLMFCLVFCFRDEAHTNRNIKLGNENSAQSFSDRSFWKSLRVVDVRAFGSWMSAPRCLFFQDFDRPDRSFGPGYPREWPPDVRGMSVPKNFLFGLIFRSWEMGSGLARCEKQKLQNLLGSMWVFEEKCFWATGPPDVCNP